MHQDEVISTLKDAAREFCREHHVNRLALFGSLLNGHYGEGSDVDLLVEFEPGHVPGLFELAQMEESLSHLLGGTRVDLRTPMDISRYFRDDVMASAEVLYVAT